MSSGLFWDITQRRVVINSRRSVTSQKSADIINIAAVVWNQGGMDPRGDCRAAAPPPPKTPTKPKFKKKQIL
jgi:uncharacterized protein YrrD